MKVGVLALQGAFREHAEAFDALGADVVLVQAARAPRGRRRARTPRRRVDDDRQAARLVRPARAADRGARARRHAGARDLRGPDRAAPTEVIDGRADQRPLGCSTSRCAATATGARSTRSRRRSRSRASPAARSPACSSARRSSNGRAGGRGARRPRRASPCSSARARSGSLRFHPELSGDLRIHQLFVES